MSLRRIVAIPAAELVPAVGLARSAKNAAGWKITQLSDTRRRESCRDVLK